MRILLTSIGRRGYLVKFFREALSPRDTVWGGDCSPYASAFSNCHHAVLLPEVTSPDYVDEVLDLCRRCDINMVVPLIDPELEVLAPRRDDFYRAGIMLVVSPPQTIEIGFDKYLTYEFGLANGIPVPRTVKTIEAAQELLAKGQFTWPLVVKPRKGSASAHISFCNDMLELRSAFQTCPLPMIQELVPGPEYGYDLFGDRECRPISVYCKQKLAMRAGETDKAVSIDDPALIGLGIRIARALPIFGPLDADVKLLDGQPRLLEINPRFGGGYPCSHLVGADFPRKLIRMHRGETLESELERPRATGIYMFKQDEIIRRADADISQAHPCDRSTVPPPPFRLLFTSVGRRVELMREFRRAAEDLSVRLEIHAVDCQSLAPGLQVADFSHVVPPIGQGYVDCLLEYCRDAGINALVPLIDPELGALSESRRRFEEVGTRLVLSDPEVIRISLDKVLTSQFLIQNGFRTPRILEEKEFATARLPLFIKPRSGSSSRGAFKIETPEALRYYRLTYPNSVVEEFVHGQEYTVDVFCDNTGQPLCAVPRMRREVRGGEVSKSQTVAHERMIAENLRLARALKGCMGMMTVQCFLDMAGEVVFTEINSRFGGGVPLSIRAGADSPRWLLELLLGRKPSVSLDGWTKQLLMLRYDSAYFRMPEDLAGPVPDTIGTHIDGGAQATWP